MVASAALAEAIMASPTVFSSSREVESQSKSSMRMWEPREGSSPFRRGSPEGSLASQSSNLLGSLLWMSCQPASLSIEGGGRVAWAGADCFLKSFCQKDGFLSAVCAVRWYLFVIANRVFSCEGFRVFK